MVGVLSFWVVDARKFSEHAQKIGLTVPQLSEDHRARAPQRLVLSAYHQKVTSASEIRPVDQ